MNAQALQKARASLLVLLRNNIGNLAGKLSKDPKTLEKIIQEYESKGGDGYDVVKSVNIGLNRTYSFSGEGGEGGGMGGEISAIAALTGAAMSLGSAASTLVCGLNRKCRKHKEKLAELEARSQTELARAQAQAAQAQALALASQQQRQGQGGSKLPLIIGISLGVIVLIVVTIILIKKR